MRVTAAHSPPLSNHPYTPAYPPSRSTTVANNFNGQLKRLSSEKSYHKYVSQAF